MKKLWATVSLVTLLATAAVAAGQSISSTVPILIPISGTLKTSTGEPRTGNLLMVISLYGDKDDAAALWVEHQTVTLDNSGTYGFYAGSTQASGVPAEFFASETARWLGVAVSDEPEQPRMMLVSVPYASKAGTADTLAGKSTNDFVLAANLKDEVNAVLQSQAAVTNSNVVSTVNAVAKFTDTAGTVGNSAIADIDGKVGIGTTNPGQPLEALGGVSSRSSISSSAPYLSLNSQPTTSFIESTAYGSGAGQDIVFRYNGITELARVATTGTFAPSGDILLPSTGQTNGGAIKLNNSLLLHAYGTRNAFAGTAAGNRSITGIDNAGFGQAALNGLTSGNNNVAVGSEALSRVTTSLNNTAVGYKALTLLTTSTAGGNTAVGNLALSEVTTGETNTAVGHIAGTQISTGVNNVALGANSMVSLSTGSWNTALGVGVLYRATGSSNTGAGMDALQALTTGVESTGLGRDALYNATTGDGNVADGFRAGYSLTTGSYNTFSGYKADTVDGTINGSTVIGYGATTSVSNSVVIGGPNVTTVKFPYGNVGIGGNSPSARLYITGDDNQLVLDTDGFSSGMFFRNRGNDKWEIYRYTDNKLHVYNYGTATDALTILESNGNVGIGTQTPAAKLHVAGDVTVDGQITVKYQDVAEWVESLESLEAGTIVVIDSSGTNRVVAATRPYASGIAGAVSRQPGVVLGEPGSGKVLVAQSGRVQIKVDAQYGAIRPGDLLVSSPTKGYAMRSRPLRINGHLIHRPGTILGKALEGLASGRAEILVLVTLQ